MARTFGRQGRWLLLLLTGLAVSGCAGLFADQSDAQRRAEEAKNIAPANYKPDLLSFLRTYLNDPTNIRAAAVSQPQLQTVGSIDRYVVCVRFNAKSSTGQYLGVQDSLAVFISGRLDRLIELERAGASPEELERYKPLREFCAAAAYQPFPELERLRR
jgi:hypothetical protein